MTEVAARELTYVRSDLAPVDVQVFLDLSGTVSVNFRDTEETRILTDPSILAQRLDVRVVFKPGNPHRLVFAQVIGVGGKLTYNDIKW